jgi:hypothetical protein
VKDRRKGIRTEIILEENVEERLINDGRDA